MDQVTLALGLVAGPWRVVRIWPHSLNVTLVHIYDRRLIVSNFRDLKKHLKNSGKKLTPPAVNAKP